MTIGFRNDSSRSIVMLDGVDRVAFNEDGSMELLTPPSAAPDANDIPTFGTSLVRATAQSATGTAIDFTGIPSWATRITLTGAAISTTGTSPFLVQGGTSSGVETTGYATGCNVFNTGITSGNSATGLRLEPGVSAAAALYTITAVLTRLSGNTWGLDGKVYRTDATGGGAGFGSKTFAGPLDRIRLTTHNGTDTFDAGSVNIMWE